MKQIVQPFGAQNKPKTVKNCKTRKPQEECNVYSIKRAQIKSRIESDGRMSKQKKIKDKRVLKVVNRITKDAHPIVMLVI